MYKHPWMKSAATAFIAAMAMVGAAVPASAQATDQKSKLEVHGFLTQAYATGTFVDGRFPNQDGSPAGPTFSEVSLGVPEDGTFDYRNMAIQFRYAISDKDIMIVQLSSRSLGDSLITKAEDDIELDWAFYERRLSDNTSLKIGRVQIPNGIFNEIRDVGTILPHFRPAYNVYQEGSFSSETVDGLSLSHTFAAESDWSLDTDIYFGQWDLVELDFLVTGAAVIAKAKDSYGIQLWQNTPVSGLRFGAAYQHREVSEGVLRLPDVPTIFDDYLFSIDAAFESWVFRAEYRQFESDPTPIPVFLAQKFATQITPYYFQIGWHPTSSFRIYAQYEKTKQEATADSFAAKQKLDLREDVSIAINYLFSPNLVIKAEYHEVEEVDQGFLPVFGPSGLKLQPIYADLDGGNYTIISCSVSF